MKNKKVLTVCVIFAVLIAAGCFTGTDSTLKSSAPAKKYTVNFNPAEEGGSLTAKIKGGGTITSGQQLPEGTVLEFTAKPKADYKVQSWENAPRDLVISSDKRTASLTVTKNTDIKVIFTSAARYKITFSAEPSEGGSITARIKGGDEYTSGKEIDEQSTVIFTAKPVFENGKVYYVEKWESDDQGLKVSPGKTTAELTVTKNAVVKVKFKQYKINPQWSAGGTIDDTNGTPHQLRFVISDSKYLSVFDENDSTDYITGMSYTENTIFLSGDGNTGTIRFIQTPTPLPSTWRIELKNVNLEYNSKALKLKDGQVDIQVTFNDGVIK